VLLAVPQQLSNVDQIRVQHLACNGGEDGYWEWASCATGLGHWRERGPLLGREGFSVGVVGSCKVGEVEEMRY
jgi:hypothetical protein